MAITLRQSAEATSSTPTLPSAPLDGSLVLIQTSNDVTATGFTDVLGDFKDTAAADVGFRLYGRAASGDTGVYSTSAITEWIIAEFTGVDTSAPLDADSVERQASSTHPHVVTTPVHTGEVLIVGAFIHNNTLEANFAPDAGYTTIRTDQYDSNTKVRGMVYKVDTNTGSYDVGVSTAPFSGGWAAAAVAWAAAGGGGGGTARSHAIVIA